VSQFDDAGRSIPPPGPSCCPVLFGFFQDPFLLLFTTPAYTLLFLSTHCLSTPIVFNNKITPALSTIIKLTHLINLSHDFPTNIFPFFETTSANSSLLK
jgi:hypothetical protein